MTALPPQIAERCAKIVGQLSSDNEGTMLAASRALVSTLRGAGLGITDLSDHIAEGPREVVVYRERPAAAQSPRDFDYGGWRRSYQGFDPRRCNRAQATKVRAAPPGFLSPWEMTFVTSLVRQMEQGRDLSPKQEGILRDIHNRFEERFG